MTQTPATSQPVNSWGQLIHQVNLSPDLLTFHRAILDLQCKVVGGEYGALWTMGPDNKPIIKAAWPAPLENSEAASTVRELLEKSVQGGFERKVSHVLKVAPEGSNDTPGIGAHVFVTVLRSGEEIAAVTTVVADCQDPNLLQSTLPMRELAGGLYENFMLRQQIIQTATEADQVRSAMALLATSQEAEGFKGAALNLVNELARQLKCARVTLGWIKGRGITLRAMSDTEELKRHSEHARLLELAMGECLDQEQPIIYPFPVGAEPLLTEAVTYAHRKLAGPDSGIYIVSIPLRLRDEWLGVLTLERETPIDGLLVTQLQLLADVIAPQLADRYETDRWLTGHAWNSVKWAASYLVGPKHVVWKMVAVLVFLCLMFVALGKMPFKISSEFTFEAQSKRIVPAPYEGDLAKVHVRPGAAVEAGQVLAQLNATELKLQLAESASQLRVSLLQRQQARAENEIATAQQAAATIKQIHARIALLEYQIEKSVIRSPIDGVVLVGDWYDKVGGVVEKGKPMFEVAPLEDLIPVLRVSEEDIDELQKYIRTNGAFPTGKLTTRSQPDQDFEFFVRRIVPLATSVNNANVFEVRSRLAVGDWSANKEYQANQTVVHDGILYRAARDSQAVSPQTDDQIWVRANWLRPGMEGLARVDMGKRPIWWVATHRITDTLHLWTWW